MKFPRKVYAIQHNQTKKIYIGSSCDVDARYMSHMYELRKGKHNVEDMQADFDEYGEDYSLYILDEITERKESNTEFKWMKKYNSNVRGIGYNYKDHVADRAYINKVQLPYKEGTPDDPILEEYEFDTRLSLVAEIKKQAETCTDISLLDLVARIFLKA